MYKTPKILTRPADSLQPLWRYFKYHHLIDLLSSEELYFAHLPGLSDGLEGSLTMRTRDRLFNWLYGQYHDTGAAANSLAEYEKHAEDFFVNCWHMNRAESYLMWRVYGDKGFAVQTTFERVQIAFDAFDGEINGGVVDYIDFSREEFDVGNVFSAVVKKDVPYRDEKEFRLLFWRVDPANERVPTGPDGVRVRVDLNKLIDKIYISPQLKDMPPQLTELIQSKGLDCTVAPSAVKER